jgi:ABC-type multidrug transport system ATPase subunit
MEAGDGESVLLECSNITYRYTEVENKVLENLNCGLERPGFYGLFGPSGVGKSTLAMILSGELDGFTGKIIREKPVRILYSYNLERLPGWSSVGDHIGKVTAGPRKKTMDVLITSFGLAPYLTSRFSHLSLGQKNRANLTRYLLQNFDLLIMDESLANVDEAMRERIILQIKHLFPEKYFLYISHSVQEVSQFCREILVLRSALKRPQLVKVAGLDHLEGQFLIRKELERIMLEIVNVS